MKVALHERASATALIVATAAVVVVLAVLQFRWSNQVSEATALRLADSLQMSLINWHLDFFRDLSEVCLSLRTDTSRAETAAADGYSTRLAEWRAAANYPGLVSHLYIVDGYDPSRPTAARLTLGSAAFEPTTWPARFDVLRGELRGTDINDGALSVDRVYARSAGVAGWRFEPSVPALMHQIGAARWLLVELDAGELRSRVLPDLANRYFTGVDGGLDYQLAIVSGSAPRRVLYSSDPDFGQQDVGDADGRMNLFGRPLPGGGSPIFVFHKPSENSGPATSVGTSWFPLLRDTPPADDWQLVVRHRRGGPLGAFVGEMHRRDLTISFGVLLLLVVSMTMWIVVSNRAQRLARLQMQFVTAVSHELRTPLTIISSAADNISSGVVAGKPQMTQYGAVIAAQARKLSGLVEEVLQFASIREARQRYNVQPVAVSELVDTTLAGAAELIQAAQFTVEREIDPRLPHVMGDPLALTQCLQNLVTNALKYGGDHRWIGIRATLGPTDDGHGQEVQISVSDRGLGISAADLPRIFDPFYRGQAVAAAQIHGTGLGLSLAKSIAEAMKGRLTVVSAPDEGSTFTLHLPSVENAGEPAAADRGDTDLQKTA